MVACLIEKHKSNIVYTVIDLFKDLGLLNLAEFYSTRFFSTGENPNPAVENEIIGNHEPSFINITPGKYEILWEKNFAPRPAELGPPIPAQDMADRPREDQIALAPMEDMADDPHAYQNAPNPEKDEGV